jgi:hypothetical protein
MRTRKSAVVSRYIAPISCTCQHREQAAPINTRASSGLFFKLKHQRARKTSQRRYGLEVELSGHKKDSLRAVSICICSSTRFLLQFYTLVRSGSKVSTIRSSEALSFVHEDAARQISGSRNRFPNYVSRDQALDVSAPTIESRFSLLVILSLPPLCRPHFRNLCKSWGRISLLDGTPDWEGSVRPKSPKTEVGSPMARIPTPTFAPTPNSWLARQYGKQ